MKFFNVSPSGFPLNSVFSCMIILVGILETRIENNLSCNIVIFVSKGLTWIGLQTN